MTEKLFYTHPYQTHTTANVTAKKITPEGCWITLDKTIFYPEGGGQPCDLGTINSIKIIDVQEKDNEIWHLVNSDISATVVNCEVDWLRRFDHMQQHGGQHIMSGVAYHLYGAQTVGFHLSDSYTTVDLRLNNNLTKEQLIKIEDEVNNIIYQNLNINCFFADAKKLKQLTLRKQPPVNEDIRIVEIEGFDQSPCCGTHPQRTGEVGLFKILKTEKIRSDIRLYIVSGNRALKNYRFKNDLVSYLIELTSANESNLYESIEKTYKQEKNKNKEINALKEKLLTYQALDLIKNSENINNINVIKYLSEELTANELKKLQNILSKSAPNSLILMASLQDNKPRIAVYFNNTNFSVGKVFKNTLNKYNGRGGGSKTAAQGGCNNYQDAKCIINELISEFTK
ncbi:metal-dependent hydrolase [Clostridium sp. 'deep sea']|uniref:alanyl-tRNA editing protein n=1 Tax=Clostridium sp. 'deep sea' TaxID=2779445 RepID=UPI0018968029|nr:DHHA1 domain-containing protein [Clostridium sp. 'deep sea']QOR35982.1 metal-dependent hydrolase [Clostridium sp. 'deep sea']